MDLKKIEGTGVALITPFHEDYSIDFASLERLVRHVSEGGVDYLVVLGTTAESPTLTMDERALVLQAVQKYNLKQLPIVYGAGGNDTYELVDYIKTDIFRHIDAVLSVTPYYNKPSQMGLERHYQIVADNCPVPIILYNVPGRTSINMQASTTLRLARHPNIIAIKEASGDFNQINQLLAQQSDDFVVLSGDDALSLPMIALGAKGAISVIANALPSDFSMLINHSLSGEYVNARKLQKKLLSICDCMSAEGNPSGLKFLLSALGLCKNVLRLPLLPVSTELERRITTLLPDVK